MYSIFTLALLASTTKKFVYYYYYYYYENDEYENDEYENDEYENGGLITTHIKLCFTILKNFGSRFSKNMLITLD